jgi:hypothetical protein
MDFADGHGILAEFQSLVLVSAGVVRCGSELNGAKATLPVYKK